MSDWREKHIEADAKNKAAMDSKILSGFRCHICNKQATSYQQDYTERGPAGYIPGDLIRCERCMKYACKDCSYNKKCRSCLEGKGLSYGTKLGIVAAVLFLIIAIIYFTSSSGGVKYTEFIYLDLIR